MLAFTDTAFARLCIAATGVDPRRRGRWLRAIAERVDPPINEPNIVSSPVARGQSRARQARWRARHREGRAIFRLDLSHDRVVEALIVSGRLSEDAALRRAEVERELAAVVEQWAERWFANKS